MYDPSHIESRATGSNFVGDYYKVISTLSILEPFRRAVVGIPFLYQKVLSQNSIETDVVTC
jgi:hypothetical protein